MDERRWKHFVGPVTLSVTMAAGVPILNRQDSPITFADHNHAAARLGHEFGGGTASSYHLVQQTSPQALASASIAGRFPPDPLHSGEPFKVVLAKDESSVGMSYLNQPERPRIVMLDCNDELVESVRGWGFDPDVAYSGYFVEHPNIELPPRLHEKDLLLIDLDPGWEPRPEDERYPRGLEEGTMRQAVGDHLRDIRRTSKPLDRFLPALQRGAWIVCLSEGRVVELSRRSETSLAWIPGLATANAHKTAFDEDKFLKITDSSRTWYEVLAQLFEDHAEHIRGHRTFLGLAGTELLINEKDEAKAKLVVVDDGAVALLPYFERKTAAVRRLLADVLPQEDATRFPARRQDWPEDDAYQMPAVQRIRDERRAAERLHGELLNRLDEAEAKAKEEQKPFVGLLTEQGEELRRLVGEALAWLEFDELRDIDAEQDKKENRVEDWMVRDGQQWTGVEVSGGKGNATEDVFLDLQKYRRWRKKADGLDDDPGGLLVMNQLNQQEPASRAELYEHSDRDWDKEARDFETGLLSTWDLFQILRRVERGELELAEARTLITGVGRIKASAE